MSRFIYILMLLVSFLPINVFASEANGIILAQDSVQISLADSMQWLKADHNNLSLAQLQSLDAATFSNAQSRSVFKGGEIYWLRLRLTNPFDKTIPLALTLSPKKIFIEASYLLTDDKWRRLIQSSRQHALMGRTGLIINIENHSDSWIYLRVRAPQTSKFDAKLQDISHYSSDISFYQQILGAAISLVAFIFFLHLLASRFHNHFRHHLMIALVIIAGVFISSHSPTPFLPDWLLSISSLAPWLMACVLSMLCQNTQRISHAVSSNSMIIIQLALLLISIILYNIPYTAMLAICLIPSTYAAIASRRVNTNLYIASMIFLFSTLWQCLYIILPESIIPPSDMQEVYGIVLTALFASISIITPYFQRQVLRKNPSVAIKQTEFLSKLSHEFRTPMNGVLGMSELLKETPLSSNQRDYLETIEQSGQDLLRLINRVSDFGKISAGNIQIEKQPFDLTELTEKSFYKFKHLANQHHLEMVLNIAQDIPHIIRSDERRLNTIIDNLLENALLNTEYGEIELKVSWENESKKDRLLFTIRDTGEGIDKEILKQILNPHNSLASSAENIKDSEFVLMLCKQLIEAMNGQFYIESNTNQGSTIRFSLAAQPSMEAINLPVQENVLSGLSILVVDDNSTLRKVIQNYAKSWGAKADTTYSGKEALAMLRSQKNLDTPYDIILIDQDMPIMDGFQLANKIKDDPDINPDLIKIMLTGLSISSQNHEVYKAGLHQVITKPVSARSLQTVLTKHVITRK